MHRILIAGCGYVGGRLAEQLVAEGVQVFGLRRGTGPMADGVVPLVGDLAEPGSLPELPAGLTGVACTVAAGTGTEEGYDRAYVRGLQGLLAWLAAGNQAPRVVFTSSTGVYGQRAGELVDEESATEPVGFRGGKMLAAEQVLLQAELPGVVVRLGGIYGPGRTSVIERARRGELTVPTEPLFTNRIHRNDAAACVRHLLQIDNPRSIYVGVDDEPVEQGEFHRWICAELGVEPPVRGSSAEPARGSKRCSNARLRASGFAFGYPTFREGYGELLRAQ